jgi:3D (Asp-Asp-Asp) domain-containing protein
MLSLALMIFFGLIQIEESLYFPSEGSTSRFQALTLLMDDLLAGAASVYRPRLANEAASPLDYSPAVELDQYPPPTLDSTTELKLPAASPSSDKTDGSKPGGKASNARAVVKSRLARLTVYWPEEGDFYTRNRKSSTGARLRDGHCAVDPKIIPYGSVVKVPGVGDLVAVDTGPEVVSRHAARVAGRTAQQRSAIVIDVFCSSRSKARQLVKNAQRFAVVSWHQPERTQKARN